MARGQPAVWLGAAVLGAALFGAALTSSPGARVSRRTLKLGDHFDLSEFEASNTAEKIGDANEAPPAAVERLRLLVRDVLDPLRRSLGKPVEVTSGFRSTAVNAAVRGSSTSQHTLGEAADIKVEGMSGEELAREIARLRLPVDQVIWYVAGLGGHVHVSHTTRRPNRRLYQWSPSRGTYLTWRPSVGVA